MDKEKELEQREKALEEREKNLEKREKELGFFSQAIKDKKESWYDRINVSVKTVDKIILSWKPPACSNCNGYVTEQICAPRCRRSPAAWFFCSQKRRTEKDLHFGRKKGKQ